MQRSPVFVYGEYEFKVHCDKKDILLLQESIKQKQFPSRRAHAIKLLECLVREPFSLVGRIFEMSTNILQVALFPLFYDKKCAKEDFAFRVARIVFLDPLALVTGVISSLIRLIFSSIGILSPKAAVYGWIGAQYVTSLNHQIKGIVWKALIQHRYKATLKSKNFFPMAIKAHLAERYLGKEVAKNLALTLKKEQVLDLDEDVKKRFKSWLELIESKSPTCIPSAIKYAAAFYKIVPIVDKLKQYKNDKNSYAQIAYESFTIKEVKYFHSFLIRYVVDKQPHLRASVRYHRRGLWVYDALNFNLKLGSVRSTTYGLRPNNFVN